MPFAGSRSAEPRGSFCSCFEASKQSENKALPVFLLCPGKLLFPARPLRAKCAIKETNPLPARVLHNRELVQLLMFAGHTAPAKTKGKGKTKAAEQARLYKEQDDESVMTNSLL